MLALRHATSRLLSLSFPELFIGIAIDSLRGLIFIFIFLELKTWLTFRWPLSVKQKKTAGLLELGGGTELEQGGFWFSLQDSFPCSNSGGKSSYFFPMLHLLLV